LTIKINYYFKYVIGSIYYVSIAALDMGIILLISENAQMYLRFIALFALAEFGSIVFYLNLLCAKVCKAAHSPYPVLNSMIAQTRIASRIRLRVLSFIEKLSGPDIGFYCFESFPMNNFELMLYSTNCIAFFILIYGLF